tara:strand:- start:1130 stop:1255 length:126 start_codon:yes stop_codon:yes gene_type:complete
METKDRDWVEKKALMESESSEIYYKSQLKKKILLEILILTF